jgi:hypothetical protein
MKINEHDIRRLMQLILSDGGITEVRALKARSNGEPHYIKKTMAGYFNDPEKVIEALNKLNYANAVYFTPNPVNPQLLGRANNKLSELSTTTSDKDITKRKYLLIDIDPIRPAGTPSNEEQHQHALDVTHKIKGYLDGFGWDSPIIADSGNGGHLIYSTDFPVDDSGKFKSCLEALAVKFDDNMVTIDQGVFNPARIWKLYGTYARKGDDSPDLGMPHRISKIVDLPSNLSTISPEKIELLTQHAPKAVEIDKKASKSSKSAIILDSNTWIEQWIKKNQIDVFPPQPWSTGGKKWVFKTCPWDDDHTDRSAYIGVFPSGAIFAGCHHNGCRDNKWEDLRTLYDGSKSPASSSIVHSDYDWHDPIPFSTGLSPVPKLDPILIPPSMHDWIVDISERMHVPMDFPTITAILVAGSLIGRKACIYPKQNDDWNIVPNLWGMLISKPGEKKSPSVGKAMKFIYKFQDMAYKDNQADMVKYDVKKKAADQTKKVLEASLKKSIEANDATNTQTIMASLEKVKCDSPIVKRYYTTDATIEKIGEICRDNPNGLLLFRDELVGWFNSLSKAGREEDRTFYLQSWNGDGQYTFDRIGRGNVVIPSLCLSVFGTIQPNVISQFIHGKKAVEDGLIQRFQLMVYPDQLDTLQDIDRAPDQQAELQAKRIYSALSNLKPRIDSLTGDPVPVDYRCEYDHGAQAMMSEWIREFEKRNRFEEFENSAMKLHYSKYSNLMPSLALIFFMIDRASGKCNFVQVQPIHVAMAGAWAEHLEAHANRVYSLESEKKYQPSLTILKMIKAGQIDGTSFHPWEVTKKGRSCLRNPAATLEALKKLEEYGWVKIKIGKSSPKGGRPSQTVIVHPDFDKFPLQSDFDQSISNQPFKWMKKLKDLIDNPSDHICQTGKSAGITEITSPTDQNPAGPTSIDDTNPSTQICQTENSAGITGNTSPTGQNPAGPTPTSDSINPFSRNTETSALAENLFQNISKMEINPFTQELI